MPDYYDTRTQLNEYLVFHYGDDAQVLQWDFGPVQALGFHKRLVGWIDADRLPSGSRALDLGCAVGRITFELSKFCESVIGIDYSESFIKAANLIKASGTASLRLTREGVWGQRLKFGLLLTSHAIAYRSCREMQKTCQLRWANST